MSALPKGHTSVSVNRQTPWEIQKAVVFATFLREIKNRFGRYTLGYFWALLEPLAYVAVLSFIRGRFTDAPIAGISPLLFFAAGVLPFILFRNLINTSVSSIEANLGLFTYQRVKPADIFVARFILECLIILSVVLLIFPALHYSGVEVQLNNFLLLVLVVLLTLMFFAGLGLLFTVLGPFWIESKKVVPLFLRPFFFISGVFFPISSIPQDARIYFLWNPLLHATELIRASAFANYTSHDASLVFLAGCGLISLALGLAVYRICRIKIVTSGTIR